ncbi:hypothetical protein MRX96_020258 [Rhipicephalus microplus]
MAPATSVFSFCLLTCRPFRESQGRLHASKKRRRQENSGRTNHHCPRPRCLPALSVATWTWQEHQEVPKCFVSDVLWKAQRRVWRETALDQVPLPFLGHTITETGMLARGARLPNPPVEGTETVEGGQPTVETPTPETIRLEPMAMTRTNRSRGAIPRRPPRSRFRGENVRTMQASQFLSATQSGSQPYTWCK